jgi:hypothetical protein
MAYKIKKKKSKAPAFSEKADYYLVDLDKQIYDNRSVKGWKNACHLNMTYQLATDNPNVIPIEKSEVLKHKELKHKNFLT